MAEMLADTTLTESPLVGLTAAADRRVTVRSMGAAAIGVLAAIGVNAGNSVARAAKRGKRGKRGKQGTPGPTTVTLASDAAELAAAAGSTASVQANCGAGQVFVGGGFDTGVTDGSVVVTLAIPDPAPSPRGYSVSYARVTGAGSPNDVSGFAICAPAS